MDCGEEDIEEIYPDDSYKLDDISPCNNDYISKMLISGYVRNENNTLLSDDVIDIIYLFSLNIKSRSMTLIAAIHLFASTIDNIMNLEDNKCEFVKNKEDELNILQYIFVRGGMCRDLLLNQDIKDIDIMVNIHQLSHKYLSHLIKFHSKKQQQHKNCKCILWRHYLNKYKENQYDPNKDDQIKWFLSYLNDEEFKKLFIFERIIQKSQYLLNAKFIKTLVFSTDLFKNAYDDIYNNVFVSKKLNLNRYFEGLSHELVQFDVVDETGCHDNYRSIITMQIYRETMSDETIKKALKCIDQYNEETMSDNKENISIPIYPFELALNFYDCTINCLHIDLYHFLKDQGIDLLWKKKIIDTKYENDLINKYNQIGFKDLKNKILRAPNINVITTESAKYYFWRLVKMITKFIHKLISKKWCVDESYLNAIKNYYDIISKSKNRSFHTKCLFHWRGDVGNIKEIKRRFVVFRYIEFEQYLKSEWKYHCKKFEKVLLNKDIQSKYRKTMLQCFVDFGYPSMNITEITKGYYDRD